MITITYKRFLLFRALFIVSIICACNTDSKSQLGIDLLGDKEKIEIPFSYKHGFIVLDVKFKQLLPLKFVLDTGAEHSILFHKEIADILNMDYNQEIKIMGADLSENVLARISRGIEMKLDGSSQVLRDIVVLEEDHLKIEEMTGLPIDGIIGGSFFKGLKVKIEYDDEKLVFYHPNTSIKKLDQYSQFPLTINYNKPYVNTTVTALDGTAVPSLLLLDTGAALTLLLHTNSDTLLALPDIVIPGNLGRGLGGDIEGYVGKVASLNLGSFKFNNLITNYQNLDSVILNNKKIFRNGLIGNNILERFEMIIDYTNAQLYLKPKKNYNKEFKYDKSGLVIYAFGRELNQFVIKHVYENSPAAEAGLKAGDIIKKVGWWGSNNYTLEKITRKLQNKEGKCVQFTVERNGEKHKIKFHLRDWFNQRKPTP